jgi:hypothetical protein
MSPGAMTTLPSTPSSAPPVNTKPDGQWSQRPGVSV